MVKKGISISLLLLYLIVNFMPYVPYIFEEYAQNKVSIDLSKEVVVSQDVNTGDIGYVKALLKRSAKKEQSKTPTIIIVNNLEFTPLFNQIKIQLYSVMDIDFIEPEMILVNHIKRLDDPPPKYFV